MAQHLLQEREIHRMQVILIKESLMVGTGCSVCGSEGSSEAMQMNDVDVVFEVMNG